MSLRPDWKFRASAKLLPNDKEKLLIILKLFAHPSKTVSLCAPYRLISNCFSCSDDNFLLHTEKSLRGFLLKINTCDALLEPIPPGISVMAFILMNNYPENITCCFGCHRRKRSHDHLSVSDHWSSLDKQRIFIAIITCIHRLSFIIK